MPELGLRATLSFEPAEAGAGRGRTHSPAMRIVRDLDAYRADADLLLTIGVFDGVHAGHRAVLSRLIAARKPGALVGAMTFERHPLAFLNPGQAPKSITTVDEKINLLDGCGLDVLFLLPFDERIQSIPAETFLREVLAARLRTRMLVVGERWRYGRGREGDCDLAARVLPPLGCAFEAAPLLEREGERISSSRIRELIAQRRFAEADELLGVPYALRGLVETGDGRGHVLGYPTANLAIAPDKLIPPPGVYAATARLEGQQYGAVVSIGDKPTFGGGKVVVEAYLLEFARSIYGAQLTLLNWTFLRDQERFDGISGLVAQIERDVAAARTALA